MKENENTGKVIYTAKISATGGRGNGIIKSSDGRLNITLTAPGAPGQGTNPEQLLAAGWSACFEDAISIAAYSKRVALPEGTVILAEVDLCSFKAEFYLQARFQVSIPGVKKEDALLLIDEARRLCPYTKALAGNIKVDFTLV